MRVFTIIIVVVVAVVVYQADHLGVKEPRRLGNGFTVKWYTLIHSNLNNASTVSSVK